MILLFAIWSWTLLLAVLAMAIHAREFLIAQEQLAYLRTHRLNGAYRVTAKGHRRSAAFRAAAKLLIATISLIALLGVQRLTPERVGPATLGAASALLLTGLLTIAGLYEQRDRRRLAELMADDALIGQEVE